ASHHQKIVCIDDTLAFVGGLDITQRRWDSPEHNSHDHRRIDPSGKSYRPFHDIQMAVQGPAARALSQLAHARWHRATNEWIPTLFPPIETQNSYWPKNLNVDFNDLPVAISRTAPKYKGEKEIRENEKLFLDSINHAKKYIYIENQYFTSKRIAEALKKKLAMPDGPEIILLVPCQNTGAFEAGTMEVLRAKLLREMRKADKFGRFFAYYPLTSDRKVPINLHSKIFISDDHFLRVGSSNLNDRSTGVDTECDISIEANGSELDQQVIRMNITRIRNRLLAEHLGLDISVIDHELRSNSLISAIKNLNSKSQMLAHCPDKIPWIKDKLSIVAKIWDTPHPLTMMHVISPIIIILGLIIIAVLGSWEQKSA
ncbi:MAG: phospholipase D-like domain-containing protein, partial [Oligoflexia bacterium]|nr:phospholipase D-like domain-containing protein [Oligoflexia bacterium]